MYTVTGWDNASVPPRQVIPLWGGYLDAPWANNLERNTDCSNFKFTAFRDDVKIGNEKGGYKKPYINFSDYPYFTCEMGVGIEKTDHRRLVVGKLDGLDMVQARLGSGSNLIGYYMFAGGSNPHGVLTSMEESQESGSYNSNPVISYDFQAAIRESGELNAPYFEIKKLHYFLNEFGDRLAPMEPVFAKNANDLQYAVRASGDSAFLFDINYCRHSPHDLTKNARFKVKLPGETITFPSKGVDIPDSSSFIWPINFRMDELNLKYATAQAICRLAEKDMVYWVFIQSFNNKPEFSLDGHSIKAISATSGEIGHADGRYTISDLNPGKSCIIKITSDKNKSYCILVLSEVESREVWLFKDGVKKTFYLTNADLYAKKDSLLLSDAASHFQIESLSTNYKLKLNGKTIKEAHDGRFSSYKLRISEEKLKITFKRISALGNAKWLKASVAHLKRYSLLNHKFFYKEITIGNPSPIKSADLWLFSDRCPLLLINNLPVNQRMAPGVLNKIDITGYLKTGKNELLFSFPTDSNQAAFASRIVINHLNYDQTEVSTDSSWRTAEKYVPPSFPINSSAFSNVMLVADRQEKKNKLPGIEYQISIPDYNVCIWATHIDLIRKSV